MRIVFLFFNGLHQLYHTAGTAMELGCLSSEAEVLCLSCNREHTSALERVRSLFPGTKTVIREIPQPFRYRFLNIKGKMYPSVNAMVRRSGKILNRSDAVVTTSHGTPGLLRKFGIDKPRIIYQYHGCGDRRYGFDPGFKRMDMMLLPGEYHRKRLLDQGITTGMPTWTVGWPKFEITGRRTHEPVFPNTNPVVLYSPHWEPELTSYSDFSQPVLDYFRRNRRINLIFAPHLLVKHWRVHHGYRMYSSTGQDDNIIIDYGSRRAVDGSWLQAADVYLGDVSSMVYEFIALKPRPCIFLNAHGVRWRGNPDYRFWEYGPVVSGMEELAELLEALPASDDRYLEVQKKRIPEYFSITGESNTKRAAKAILEYMETL